MSKRLILDVNEKPKPLKWVLMSFQHVFAMFGATIAVPLALGMPVSVALFASGIGTLIYVLCTKGKVPIYLGSSFAYITALAIAKTAMGGDMSAGQTGLILVGIIYVIVAVIVRFTGTKWLHKILPPIVIGPMIIIIGLGLANYAVTSAGLVANGGIKPIIVALVAFVISVVISTKAKGFLKIVPFLVAIIGGYVVASLMGLVDFTPVIEANWIAVPEFIFPFKIGNFASYKLYFGPETFAILPLAIVTIAEHIGDHTVLGKICDKDFLQDPGLNRTLIGDGVATTVSALIGGPANTTYGENTGVIGLTGVASVWVTSGAAVIAVLISFLGKFTALLQVMPTAVMGGMSIILYGVIASNGLRTLIDNKVDFNETRNLIIASSMLVIGLGGAVLNLEIVSFSGTALAALVGVILNLVLPQTKKEKKVEKLEKELVDSK
ncbi:MAG: NCS2 family nucleobase:cation symporter [Bacilli bacterium]|nr:NCS2 family nucleobase:cation symporter [Bacilli bacterium]